MKIVFCSSEAVPFAKTGGLADVCGSLPIELEKLGMEIAIILPGYRSVGQSGFVIEKINEKASRTILGSNIHVYFIESPHYFDREGIYGDASGDYPDNLDRFSYFCTEALDLLKQLDVKPDILHCHDWQTALIPVYLKEKHKGDEFFAETKTILTVHNLAFQGVFPKEQYVKLGLSKKIFSAQGFEFYDQVNLLKAGIIFSDKVTTVSPQYAKEIRTKEFGCGLEGVLKERFDGVIGILNGLDHDIWNPATDMCITERYTMDNFADAKLANKIQLQKELNFEVRDDVPLFGFVGRLSHQKGIDLIIETLEAMVKMDVQVAILGMGEQKYHDQLRELAELYSDNIAVCFDFNEHLGHQIYAGSDLFLMPSRFEPCGLTQMISLYYGAIPIAFKTGGLADTITSGGPLHTHGNGFIFTKYTKEAFLSVIKKAVNAFEQEDKFDHLRGNALQSDFAWKSSAQKYLEIYSAIEKR